eukprot:366225-Chlamydomonas_euryale.AAC.8
MLPGAFAHAGLLHYGGRQPPPPLLQQPTDRFLSRPRLFAALGAALAPEAKAIKIPSQESTGGMVTGNGSMTKSPSAAVSCNHGAG